MQLALHWEGITLCLQPPTAQLQLHTFPLPHPSLLPPAPGTEQQLCTKCWQQKGSTATAKWPLLLYSPALKLFCEVHSFAILGIEIWFYISFTCLHNSAHYQVRRDHNGKITFGRKMLVILYCKGKKIVKAYVSFLEKHEGKTHTISRAISSLNQSHLFFPVYLSHCMVICEHNWCRVRGKAFGSIILVYGGALW